MLLQSWELKENGLKREYDEVAGRVKFFAINPQLNIKAIEAIAPDTAPVTIEKSLPDELAVAKITYASKLKITYKRNPDGSLMLKSIRGITEKDFKKLSDGELKALGLYRESKGVTTKYWEIQADRLEGKAVAISGKRFTIQEAIAYYTKKSGKPLSETSFKQNAKQYGFAIKERGSGKYALIDG